MSTADYALNFEDRGGYLYVCISGRDSFAASLQYWNEIADEIARRGHDRLLVHERMEGQVSVQEMYALIRDLKDSSLKGVKIAVYDEMAADSFLNMLGKLFANYRGGDVRIFSRLEAARKWIEPPAGPRP